MNKKKLGSKTPIKRVSFKPPQVDFGLKFGQRQREIMQRIGTVPPIIKKLIIYLLNISLILHT